MNTTKKAKKQKVTSENFSELLLESANQMAQHAQGKIDLKSEELELPAEPPLFSKSAIKKIREKLNFSQSVFASYLGCTTQSVQAWEQGRIKPNSPTRRLLQIFDANPSLALKLVSGINKR